ncbi:peptide ABC transporter substrate-binding protein [Tetragenococcus halophilus]|uniref:peptide ABC transporter substrate-binding protein n=1 Tax=Tetragenococcus halophilus TaxID=51669 RepID=UPI0019297D54|nr:peptide ABC transporter substrate-binding protein [Tetragenococcus halophilus]MCF1602482.1 peptide ABC transporter substrate-binding protein [Tetragenococcus halophilus]MCF1676724.1 peptide ABC transporter substrate-binding protein [Tetragenococcus halophilus]MDN6112120.1 peptide ABC transporter substrate-binding protein [Tetragenococcus halophilus]MDN6163324.1 peptide ABC transporter substrate-binding protein [Tetragenococcus halophilus]MDN6186881.1 peptide ABC transporter substrate-bindin
MRKKHVYSLFAMSALVLAGCTTGGTQDSGDEGAGGGGSGTSGNEYTFIERQEMPTADLSQATDTVSFSALNNVYEGIYRLDENNEPQPAGAAEEAEVSDDGLTYTIQLREDATWSNGDPVTADDYVYGWQRTVDPETASEFAYIYEPVENAEAVMDGDADLDELGIEAVDDYELEITLERPTEYFDNLLAFPVFFPQNEEVVEENGDDYAQTSDNLVYNGPFVLADFDGPGSDTEWAYDKNEDYWDADNVSLDRVNVNVVKEASTALNLFQDGQADEITLSGELAQQMANDPDYLTVPQASTFYMEMNQDDEDSPFNNENFRKAISYSIDREALVNSVLADGSIEPSGLVPSDMSENPETGDDFIEDAGSQVEYDPEQAQEYWEQAQEELGEDSLEIDLLADDTDGSRRAQEFLQESIQDSLDGVSVSLSPVPFSVRLDRSTSGDFDMALSGWAADYADPSAFLDLFQTDTSNNHGKYSNEDYDQQMDEATNENGNDPEARWGNLVEAEKIIMEDQGVVPLYQNAEAHLRADRINGLVSHPAGAQYDYKWVTVDE